MVWDVSVYYSPNSFPLVRNLLSFNNLIDGNIITLARSKVVSGQWSVRFYANTLYLQDDTKKIVIIYI